MAMCPGAIRKLKDAIRGDYLSKAPDYTVYSTEVSVKDEDGSAYKVWKVTNQALNNDTTD